MPKYTLAQSKRRELFEQNLNNKSSDKFYDTNTNIGKKTVLVYKISESVRLKK
jgi:hypothetical protein